MWSCLVCQMKFIKKRLIMKFTIETDCPHEAQAILSAIARGKQPDVKRFVINKDQPGSPLISEAVDAGRSISDNPENRVDPDDYDELDSNGMPWNPELHAGTRAKNKDGSWKAQRGKKALADQQAADFKAAGGNITPPQIDDDRPLDEPATTTQAPVTEMPPATVTMTEVEPQPAPPAHADITQQQVEAKVVELMNANIITMDNGSEVGGASEGSYQRLLDDFNISRSDPATVLKDDPALRASFYQALVVLANA